MHHDPDPFRRWEAVFSLRKLVDPGSVPALVALLRGGDEDARVRSEAALVLGRADGEVATGALLEALRLDPSPQVRRRAAMSLGGNRSAALAGPLREALAAEADPDVRASLERALAAR